MTLIDTLVDRLALRTRLYRLGPAAGVRQRSISRRERAFAGRRLPASPTTWPALAADGIVCLDRAAAAHLFGETGVRAIAEAAADLSDDRVWGDRRLIETDEVWRTRPDLFLVGLREPLIDLVESYLRQECCYLACSIKRERPDGRRDGVRRWHLDVEDDRMVRVLVYLNEVGPGDGAFEYLAAPVTDLVKERLGYRYGYLDEARLATAVRAGDPRSCFGAAGSAVVFDGARVLHRASQPVSSPRYSVSFTYTTRHPLHVFSATRLSRDAHRRLCAEVGPGVRAVLPRRRALFD